MLAGRGRESPLTVGGTIPGQPAVWLFDFDNTLAALEPEVDWTASRHELEAYLRSEGIGDAIFVEFPRGNLLLYEALRSRLQDGTHATPGFIASEHLRVTSDHLHFIPKEHLLQRASEIVESYELRGVGRAAPLPGAHELLRALADGHTSIVVVTSNSSRTVARWLELHRVDRLVRAIVGRDSMLALKPAPASIEHALALCSATPADAIFVGDSEADLIAARRAHVGFYGVAISEEVRRKLEVGGASIVFASPAALAEYLDLPKSGR
ncbi:MAG: HAD family hydrolase [Chthoniobacterales bacterium]